jgi:hypothetical protein
MRPAIRILTALAAGIVLAAPLAAPTPALAADAAPVKALGTSVSATGTITAIDMATRHVTIRSAEGDEETFVAGKSVRLEKAKVGDQVQLDYSVAVAVSVKKGGGAPVVRTEAASATRSASSATPAIHATTHTTIVADVLGVDQATQMLKLKGPEGHVVDVKVRDKKALADVAVGDQVVADVTEAVAVSLKPTAPAASQAQ